MWNVEIKPNKTLKLAYHGGPVFRENCTRAEVKVSDRDSRCCHCHERLQREVEPASDVDERHLATTWH
jgi:hypothetical protein